MNVAFANDNKKPNPFLEKIKSIFAKLKTWTIPSAFYYFLILIAIASVFTSLCLLRTDSHLLMAAIIPLNISLWDITSGIIIMIG